MKKILFFKSSLYFFSLFLIPVSVANSNEPLSLTLQETIETVLKNNISISVQSYNSKINEQFIFEKEADFDPTVDFEFTVGEETRQSASTLADSKTRNLDYD